MRKNDFTVSDVKEKMVDSDEEGDFPLHGFFKRYEAEFLASLKKSVSVVGSDNYVQQMFEDKLSASYIPDRICELVIGVLKDDREKNLQKLTTRLNAIEICLGKDRCDEVEKVGTKLIDLLSIPNRDDEKFKEYYDNLITILTLVTNKLQKRTGKSSNSNKSPPEALKDMKKILNSTHKLITSFSKDMRAMKVQVHKQAQKYASKQQKDSLQKIKLDKNSSQIYEAKPNRNSPSNEEVINEYKSKIKQLKAHIKELAIQNQNLQEDYDETMNKCKEKIQKLHEEKKQIKTYFQENLSSLTESNKKLIAKVAQLHQDKDSLKDALDEQIKNQPPEDLIKILKDKVRKTREENKEMNKSTTEFSQTIILKEQQIRSLTEHGDELVRENTILEQNMREMQEAYKNRMKEYKNEIKKLTISQTEQFAIIESNNTQIAELTANIEKKAKAIDEKSQELSFLNQVIESISNLLTEPVEVKYIPKTIKMLFKDQNKQIIELTQQIEVLSSEKEVNSATITELQAVASKVESQNMELKLLRKENRQMKRDLQKKNADLDIFKTTSQKMQADQMKDLMKQIKELQNKITRVQTQAARHYKIQEFEDIPKVLSEAKSKEILLNKIQSILNFETTVDFLHELKKMRQQAKAVEEVMALLNISQTERIAKGITRITTEHKEMKDREAQMLDILKIESPTSIVDRVIQLIQVSNELNKLKDQVSSDNVGSQIEELIKQKKELEKREEEIMIEVAASSSNAILMKIKEMKDENIEEGKILEDLCSLLEVEDLEEIKSEITSLIQFKKEYSIGELEDMKKNREMANAVYEILETQSVGDFKLRIAEYEEDKHKLERIESFFDEDSEQQIKELLAKNVNFNEMVSNYQKDLIEASHFLTKITSKVLGSEVEFTFPLVQDHQDRLINLIDESIKENNRDKQQFIDVFKAACSYGYEGSKISEALESIIEGSKKSERSRIFEEMKARCGPSS